MKRVSITHVNNLHSDWLRSLDFYKQELDILAGRLNEIAAKNTANEVQKQVEHYQNAITVQRDNIDRLNHDIHTNITGISNAAHEDSAGYVDSTLLTQHYQLHEQFTLEEKVINETRQGFMRFAAEWM